MAPVDSGEGSFGFYSIAKLTPYQVLSGGKQHLDQLKGVGCSRGRKKIKRDEGEIVR